MSISGGSLDAAVSLYYEDPTLAGGPDPSSSTDVSVGGGGNNPIDVDEDTDDDSIGGKKAGGETNAGKIKKVIIEVRRDGGGM